MSWLALTSEPPPAHWLLPTPLLRPQTMTVSKLRISASATQSESLMVGSSVFSICLPSVVKIDAVSASTDGTVQNIGYSDYYEWYDVDWELINVKEGWIPEADVHLY
jgi:hypothetical protein